jgi:hypothetical protein
VGHPGAGTRFLSSIFNYIANAAPLPLVNKDTGSVHGTDANNLFLWPSDVMFDSLSNITQFKNNTKRPSNFLHYNKKVFETLQLEQLINDNFEFFNTSVKNQILTIYANELSKKIPIFCLRSHAPTTLLTQILQLTNIKFWIIEIQAESLMARCAMYAFGKMKNGAILPEMVQKVFDYELQHRNFSNISNVVMPNFSFSFILNKDINNIMNFIDNTTLTINLHTTQNQMHSIKNFVKEYCEYQPYIIK